MAHVLLLEADSYETVGALDTTYSKLEIVQRYWGNDYFKMEFDRRVLYGSEVKKGRFLYLPHEHGIFRVERLQSTRDGESNNVVVAGRGVDGFISDHRRVLPPPDESHLVIDNVPAETAMKALVEACATVGARAVPGLTVAPSAGRGPLVSVAARFQTLGYWLALLGRLSGLGWHVHLEDGLLEWDVLEGTDRSDEVFFAFRFETLESWEHFDSDVDSDTLAIVAGQGDLEERDVSIRWQGGSEPSGWERREAFLDAREIEKDDWSALEAKGDAYLAEHEPERRFEAKPHQLGSFRLGEHWHLGDLVRAQAREENLDEVKRIVELRRTYDESAVVADTTVILDRALPDIREGVEALTYSGSSTRAAALVADAGGAGGGGGGGEPGEHGHKQIDYPDSPAEAAEYLARIKRSADTKHRATLGLDSDGRGMLGFGPGSGPDHDLILRRVGSGVLSLESDGNNSAYLYARAPEFYAGGLLAARVSDSQARLLAGIDGDHVPTIAMGAGGSRDTRIRRSGAKTLTVDDGAGGAATVNVVGALQRSGTAVSVEGHTHAGGSVSGAEVHNLAHSMSNNAQNVVSFDTEVSDTDNYWAASPNPSRIVAPTTGWYMITAHSDFVGSDSTAGIRIMYFRKNQNGGTSDVYGNLLATQTITPSGATNSGTSRCSLSWVGQLTAADYIQLMYYQNSGAARTVRFWLQIVRIG